MSNVESLSSQTPNLPGSEPSTQRRLDPSLGSNWLLVAGLGAALAGAFVGFGAKLVPDQAHLIQQISSRGVSAGVLWCSAAALLGLGLVARRIGRSLDLIADREEENFVIEQLASDMAQSRASLQELRVEFIYLKDALGTLGRDLPARLSEASENSTRDAMYRLAASLDQVGARLEQRIRSQQGTLEDTLHELQSSLQMTCEQVSQLTLGMTTAPSPSPASGWEVPAEPAAPPIGLGVLDTLGDEQPLDLGWDAAAAQSVQAPLPSMQPSYEQKLSQLSELLSDPRVRAACDSLVRSARS